MKQIETVVTNSSKPDKLSTLIKAADVDDVESIWTTLFAKVDFNDLEICKLLLMWRLGSRRKEC